MLLIDCPYCGVRPEVEFRCGGEAHFARPTDPAAQSDAAWAEHLYIRTNPRGVHAERWLHAHGCGRWFNALRHTVTDAFVTTYRVGTTRPDRKDAAGASGTTGDEAVAAAPCQDRGVAAGASGTTGDGTVAAAPRPDHGVAAGVGGTTGDETVAAGPGRSDAQGDGAPSTMNAGMASPPPATSNGDAR